jgi:dTDP-4-amino-4,6-dideoxygalactose transaminase
VKKFEERIAEFIGVEPELVIGVATGTAAVHVALELCNVGPGDEVITPSLNNIADLQMIRALHANPVFCDVSNDTLTIDPSKIEELITPRTKAIIALDYGCSLCDYNAVRTIADKHGVPVLYDAAHSFGSTDNFGRKIGSFGQFVTFSFDPVKNITAIDGGAIIVEDVEVAQRVRHMRLLGQRQDQKVLDQNKRSWRYDVDGKGYRYHLANLHAAIGIEQMKKIETIYSLRNHIFDRYDEALNDIDCIQKPIKNGADVMPFLYVVRVLKGPRIQFQELLERQGVDTGIHWLPGHEFTGFRDCCKGDLTVTNQIADQIVSLPFFPELSDESIDRIRVAIHTYNDMV